MSEEAQQQNGTEAPALQMQAAPTPTIVDMTYLRNLSAQVNAEYEANHNQFLAFAGKNALAARVIQLAIIGLQASEAESE